ncbi:MAG: hypothetical protein ABFD92_15070 [Planctomycetaceae bacterium]
MDEWMDGILGPSVWAAVIIPIFQHSIIPPLLPSALSAISAVKGTLNES